MLSQINSTLLVFACACVLIVVTICIFTMITKYNDWQEIKKGNIAAAMILAGNIFGIGNIVRFAITSNSNLLDTLIWGIIGLGILIIVYVLFERLAPSFCVEDEISNGNKAVGLIIMALSVAFSYIIGASIS